MYVRISENPDGAVLKLCYTDIRDGTDVESVFLAYADTPTFLQADFPDFTFVPATVPLQVKRGPLGKAKAWIGQPDRLGPEHNTAQEQFSALVRAECRDALHLFDVAAIEPTSQDGRRLAGSHDGDLFYSFDKAYAPQPGQLNATAATPTAERFNTVIADAVAD